MRHLDRVRCPVLVGYGSNESPEFKRHGREFGAALRRAGLASTLVELEGCNHFEVVAGLQDPASQVSRAVIAHIGL
jgi:arylformamidase